MLGNIVLPNISVSIAAVFANGASETVCALTIGLLLSSEIVISTDCVRPEMFATAIDVLFAAGLFIFAAMGVSVNVDAQEAVASESRVSGTPICHVGLPSAGVKMNVAGPPSGRQAWRHLAP